MPFTLLRMICFQSCWLDAQEAFMRLYQWEYNFRQGWLPKLLLLCLLLTGTLEGLGIPAAQAECDTPSVPQDKLQPLISSDSPGYRTPRTGEGFRTELFGREIKVQPENILGGRDKVIFLIVKEVFGNEDIVPLPLEIIIKIVPFLSRTETFLCKVSYLAVYSI